MVSRTGSPIESTCSPISDIGAFRSGRWQLADFIQALRLALDWTVQHRAVFDFLAHPSCLGVVDPELKTIDFICDFVEASRGQARLADLSELAGRAVVS